LVDRNSRTALDMSDPSARIRWHAMLTRIAIDRGYKLGWAAHKFKEKFGAWPAVNSISPIEPSLEVLSWVRSRNIAWAKSKARAA
jgi:DNA repair protein RadD